MSDYLEGNPCRARRICICDWGSVCSEIQSRLSASCADKGINHVALGTIRISTSAPSNKPLLESIYRHLLPNAQPKQILEINVARHHFPLALLEYNGNKAIVVGQKKLPAIPGMGKKLRYFFTPLTKELALKFGISDDADRFSKDSSNKFYDHYIQAPLALQSVVLETIPLAPPPQIPVQDTSLSENSKTVVNNPTSFRSIDNEADHHGKTNPKDRRRKRKMQNFTRQRLESLCNAIEVVQRQSPELDNTACYRAKRHRFVENHGKSRK